MKIIIVSLIVLLLVGIVSVAAAKDNPWQGTWMIHHKNIDNNKWKSYHSDDFKTGFMKHEFGKYGNFTSRSMNHKFGKHPSFDNKNINHRFGKYSDSKSGIMKHKFVKKYKEEVVVVWPNGHKEAHNV